MADVIIPNPDFTSGSTGWTLAATSPSTINWSATGGKTDPGCIRFQRAAGSGEFSDGSCTLTTALPCIPGRTFNANVQCRILLGSPGSSMRIGVQWFDSSGVYISEAAGNEVVRYIAGSGWSTSSVSATPPAGAASCRLVGVFNVGSNSDVHDMYLDEFRWNNTTPDIVLLYPLTTTYAFGDSIPFRINTDSGVTITEVRYYAENTDTSVEVLVGTATADPWGVNVDTLPEGDYVARAEVDISGGTVLDTNTVAFSVGEPIPPTTREYKASNAYTYLVAKNFVGIASAIPPTAQVTGVQAVVDYYMQALIRSKDIGVEDLTAARYTAAFDMVPSVTFEAVLLDDNSSSYTAVGGTVTATQTVERSDYSVTEDGTSEGKRWTILLGDAQQVTIGSSSSLFGQSPITASEFITKAYGLRVYPNLAAKPDFADTGDACFRTRLNKFRLQIYFDAGSVEYYFVSPDGTQVIKGELAAAYIDEGAFANGDASGVMQLTQNLETVQGTATTIEEDWTIHSAYPATDANQIGVVNADMSYNGLPTYGEVEENRSRYQFISANFYGDLSYDSIYGVNGVDRAFSYNGDYFYKIHTQPDPVKDKPRHVEFYSTHLALGYGEGRVDISVIGEPYNFDGADGASSWAIGDSVVGLLNLSGTMLGIFCKKSISGLAGTTVDNFALQTLSPKIGAVEYTITDMGFPVYANAYGIYTLAQTDQYGDYLGTPLSQDVSPYLRPRLVRKITSPREVVVAWPVRSKNQYKLAFADAQVLTMTLNNGTQTAPTFSKQKYFTDQQFEVVETIYDYEAIVPAAISSQLDDGGEERIHIANKQPYHIGSSSSGGTPPSNTIFLDLDTSDFIYQSDFKNSSGTPTLPPGFTWPTSGTSYINLTHAADVDALFVFDIANNRYQRDSGYINSGTWTDTNMEFAYNGGTLSTVQITVDRT